MTSGSATLKNFSNFMSKKRQRSGSGGSKEHCDARKKSFISKRKSSKEQRHGERNMHSNITQLEEHFFSTNASPRK